MGILSTNVEQSISSLGVLQSEVSSSTSAINQSITGSGILSTDVEQSISSLGVLQSEVSSSTSAINQSIITGQLELDVQQSVTSLMNYLRMLNNLVVGNTPIRNFNIYCAINQSITSLEIKVDMVNLIMKLVLLVLLVIYY